jgi:hypothetical protein
LEILIMADRSLSQNSLLSRIQENSRTWFGWMPPSKHRNDQAEADDRYQPRFWDVDGLEEAISQNRGPLLLDVASCKVEFVPGPAGDDQAAMWLPVMVFHGRQRRLIIDNTIAQVLSSCTRSRLVLAWGQVGRVALFVKDIDGKKKIMVKPIGTRPLTRHLPASPPF